MFHLIQGKVTHHGHQCYIEHDHFGIAAIYTGKKKKGTFFLHPQLDQATGSIRYYAFDKAIQKQQFEKLTKIQGIWSKSGYHLAMLPMNDLAAAVDGMDMQYFQKLPGIGPKTAKRILLEMKQTVTAADLWQLDIDETLYKDIVASLKSLGYEARKVRKILPDCPVKLEKKKLPEIMKRLIDHL